MRFTLSWLRDHLETDAPLATIADTLTAIGLEVESVNDPGAALTPFVIARVVEAVPHPNADRLRVCRVDAGAAEVSVVCGAPNARAGMRAVFAPPGAIVPGTGVTLKVGQIRGVESAGMLVSALELGLGEDHSGIIELPEDAPVGASYAAWAGLDDPVIEIGVTPNRGDALAVRGIARDLAATGIGTLKPWAAAAAPVRAAGGPRWVIEWPEACPWVLGRLIRGVRNGKSPEWLRRRLTSVGLRPISALVDVTNFLALDLGRPLHVFDADKIAGDVLTLRPGRDETFTGLHGKAVTATSDDLVIADAAGARSLGGIVGGEATSCDEGTVNVFVECALFDRVRVALGGRRHQVASDARARFERGIDPALLPDGLEAATRLVMDLCGGEAGPVVSAGAEPDWRRSATMRFARLAGLGGATVPPERAADILGRLGFGTEARDADRITVSVPSWRNDVAAPVALDQAPGLGAAGEDAAASCAAIEAECDLVEEVLRIHGLDRVPAVSMPRAAPVPAASLTPAQARRATARRVLAARGLDECVLFSFVSSEMAELFGAPAPGLILANPIAADLDRMRPTALAGLAAAAARNVARGQPDVALFEIGPGFDDAGQRWIAAGLRVGATPRNALAPARPADAYDAKADALAVLAALGVAAEALSVTADAPAHYHPGRSGVLRQGPRVLAAFGELHPRVAAAVGTGGAALEVFLDMVPEPKRRRAAPVLSALQPVRRDFAFLVPRDLPAETVARAARGAERTLIAGVTLFDRFDGGGVPEGQVSLGIEVTLQPIERTLTDAEIEAVCAKVVAAVAKAGGMLR